MKHIFLSAVVLVLIFVAAACGEVSDAQGTTPTQPVATPEPTETAAPEETQMSDAVSATPPEAVPTSGTTPTPDPTDDPTMVALADGFYYVALNDDIKARITGMSYPTGDTDCAVSYNDLRYIRLRHYDFDGNIKDGELIVNALVADEVLEIFHELYLAEYPLASVVLVDDFGEPGDDNLSMAANNTSAFNYRYVTGTKTLSRHSYGAAVDINPVFNPYIDGDRIVPGNSIMYVDRSLGLPGMIDHDDLCYQLFVQHGWVWGGDWSGDKDYQHFSKDLGF